MKVNELMVGDLVSVSGKSVKITKDDLATMLIFLDDDSKIDPIPLTEGILVKNGFLKRSGKEYYLKDDIVIFVGSDSCEVCTLYGECTAYSYVEEGYTTIATINYVHQLQHLLRLAGVQKEIEL